MPVSYPPDFQSWPLEKRNAWFADEAAAYRETRQKVNGNGGKDASENQWLDPGSVATVAGTTADPLPLFPPLEKAEPYPVEALGATLSRAAKAVASKVQVPVAMAAQSVLAAASLAACSHADVTLSHGQTRPLTLYFATVAASGDRKSTADNEALWPIEKREKSLRELNWSFATAGQ